MSQRLTDAVIRDVQDSRPRPPLGSAGGSDNLVGSLTYHVEAQAPLRIQGETAYPVSAASARVRVAQFAPHLADHGIDLRFDSNLSAEEYSLLASSAPAVRKATVLSKSALRAVLRQRKEQLHLVHRLRLMTPLPFVDPPNHVDVYDFDDAIFEGSAAAVNARFQWAKQESRRALTSMRRARLVIAGNSYLADSVRPHNSNVEVVPSCVDPSNQPLHEHKPLDVVRVGWIGSHTTSPYLEPILPVLARLNRGRMRARLVVVGGRIDLDAEWLEQRPWSLETQARDLASFDVGIMPIPDTTWARGKCGYKILQYFAAGVPAVAPPIGVNRALIGADRGLFASSDEEWFSALDHLIADVDERRELGARARAFAEDSYSYQHWAPHLATLFRTLTE